MKNMDLGLLKQSTETRKVKSWNKAYRVKTSLKWLLRLQGTDTCIELIGPDFFKGTSNLFLVLLLINFKLSRANAGVVTVKVYATSEEDVNILKNGVTVSSLRGHRPDAIVSRSRSCSSVVSITGRVS